MATSTSSAPGASAIWKFAVMKCERRPFSLLCIIGSDNQRAGGVSGVAEFEIGGAANRVAKQIAEAQRVDQRRLQFDRCATKLR